ncbi:MAG: hypothetical protein AAB529_00850 [Patescibacteria group bacterium]|mgnify:FL=1
MEYKKVISVFVAVFILFFYGFNFTAALEVQYPALSTGASITANTPLPEYLKYVFDFGMFLGFFIIFLTLVFAGVLYLLSPAVPNASAMAKDRVSGAISGLLILATVYLIITTINPELKIFKLGEIDTVPPPPDPEQQAGVYIYNQNNCSPLVPESPHVTNIPDLGPLTNRANAVDIVQHPGENIYYISILYDSPNFWGKCQYINPNRRCVQIEPFAASASIYQYDNSPSDEGVVFYRKSFYNREGGWYRVSNDDIKNAIKNGKIYVMELSKFKFNDVPENEQNCIKWDMGGFCIAKEPPSLSGKNISSIEIKGDYMVLLVYFDKSSDAETGPWSFCQAFPTKDDVNKDGPKQIKWESVRNISTGNPPNFAIIFSVKQK